VRGDLSLRSALVYDLCCLEADRVEADTSLSLSLERTLVFYFLINSKRLSLACAVAGAGDRAFDFRQHFLDSLSHFRSHCCDAASQLASKHRVESRRHLRHGAASKCR
jgi:hypothetical protein